MNYFSYEVLVKEKIRGMQEEGLRSQALHRSGVSKVNLLPRLPKLILIILGILGVVELIIR
jgi:hypothetical protein